MRDGIGTFDDTRPRKTGVNVTKSRVLGHQNFRNPLIGLEKAVYILVGRCTYPFKRRKTADSNTITFPHGFL